MNTEKLAIITGGTSGVGKKTAIDLARKNMRILLVARNKDKGKQAVEEITKLTGNNNITFYSVDLTNKNDIDKFSNIILQKEMKIDVLVNAAGALVKKEESTENGYNKNYVVNYLGHFWLTENFLPLLKNAEQGRIITVGGLPLLTNYGAVKIPSVEEVRNTKSSMIKESLTSKVLYTLALSQKLADTSVTANIFHPGYVTDSQYGMPTNFLANFLYKLFGKILTYIFNILSEPNPEIGLKLALENSLSTTTGKFFNEKGEILSLSKRYSQDKIDKILINSNQF
ncbi:SDR family NAD(P)-dependent oxidoreductase [Staphylococcus xylosus]|uniref:SDR family NAD(P)-dependent oxidoreductase n=1 Tax=Staphylococcus xylosus TaxID=1288 RepID=UPI000E68EE48|nr:SDR family NAD(P)-dependent oxidoreductase [Staphylococcus xylosus]RIM75561.1 SDR family NAD(P)-dependent oxidoreductase [Staphylococcus xylosus]